MHLIDPVIALSKDCVLPPLGSLCVSLIIHHVVLHLYIVYIICIGINFTKLEILLPKSLINCKFPLFH